MPAATITVSDGEDGSLGIDLTFDTGAGPSTESRAHFLAAALFEMGAGLLQRLPQPARAPAQAPGLVLPFPAAAEPPQETSA